MAVTVKAGGVWLQQVGEVVDLSWSTTWGDGPGGCELASWRLRYPASHVPPMVRRGQRVEIHDGSSIPLWTGLAAEPIPGDGVWECHARGYAREASRFLALDVSLDPTGVPSTAVSQAISRGLPWVGSPTLSTVTLDGSQTPTIEGLLTAAAAEDGVRWGVFADQAIQTGVTPPDARAWRVAPEVPPPGVADDSYVSALFGRYVSAVTGTPPQPSSYDTAVVVDADAESRWGRVEALVDYTKAGLMTSGDVSTNLSGRMDLAGARFAYTNAITVARDTLTTLQGTPGDPRQVQAGDTIHMARVRDDSGSLLPGAMVTFVVGRVSVDALGATAVVEPVGMAARDLSSILANPEPLRELTETADA